MIKAKKKLNTNRGFQWLYAPITLIDSIYRIDENYYPKVFLEKYFIEDIYIFGSNSDEEYYK